MRWKLLTFLLHLILQLQGWDGSNQWYDIEESLASFLA